MRPVHLPEAIESIAPTFSRQGGMRCPQRVGQESGYAADVCAFGRLPAAIVFGEADPPFAAAAI